MSGRVGVVPVVVDGGPLDPRGHPQDRCPHGEIGGEGPIGAGAALGFPPPDDVGHEHPHGDAHDTVRAQLRVRLEVDALQPVVGDDAADADAGVNGVELTGHEEGRVPGFAGVAIG